MNMNSDEILKKQFSKNMKLVKKKKKKINKMKNTALVSVLYIYIYI